MSTRLKLVYMVLMSTALAFGFLHQFVPDNFPYNFERLHIFLFNLCSGGSIILLFSERRDTASKKIILFIFLSVVYAILAFFEMYPPAMLISLILAGIVETVRIKRYAVLPLDFFRGNVPIAEKFNQASLLCLSTGLIISCMVIWNNEYLHLVSFEKLTLNTFFLGFSFPVSLITFSVIFGLMKNETDRSTHFLKEIGFWFVNLGVIIFFVFILLEMPMAQVAVTITLLATVIMIFFLYRRLGLKTQQKNFLSSGMGFLLYTAVTGIAYIIFALYPEAYTPDRGKLILRIHSFAALYGWNLSGLAIICRYNDFPLKLHSRWLIVAHWLTVVFAAPLGSYHPLSAIVASTGYTIILYIIFFNKGRVKNTTKNMSGQT